MKETFLQAYWLHALQIAFFLANLYWFYAVLIYNLGSSAALMCNGIWSCRRRLQPAQPFGHIVDLSDGQWREFRQYLGLFVLAAVASVLADHLYRVAVAKTESPYSPVYLYGKLAIGVAFLIVQHGYHSLLIAVFVALAYWAPRASSYKIVSLTLVWMLGISILLLKESYRLFSFPGIYPYVWWLRPLFDQRFGGLYRWQLPANFLALRVISYGIDCTRARHSSPPEDERDKKARDAILSDHDTEDAVACATYLLYAPLYMAGPITTYRSFLAGARHGQSAVQPWIYALRWLASFLLLEWMLSRFPVFAIASSGLLTHLPLSEAAAVVYLLLKVMWLKFLLIWRFFRAWALFDGILPPENMLRCMSNNYSLEGFWKGWHASFNQWLVQYMYIPLGGRQYRYLTAWPIFLFVAWWHDAEVQLIVWGAANALFFAIESRLKPYAGYHKRTDLLAMSLPQTLLASVVCAGYILILMAVNLVGYALGTGGLSHLLSRLATWEGVQVLLAAMYFLSVGVNIMFYLRRIGWLSDYQ